MNSINVEKEKLIETLAGECFEYDFPSVNESIDSYFEEYELVNEQGVYELNFNSVLELVRMLHEKKSVINSEKINIQCAVNAFKNRKEYKREELKKEQSEIPEYIYNF